MGAAEEAGLARHREAVVASAAGRVLEIGAGTGANLRFYGDAVKELVATEPDEPMARRLEKKLRGCGVPARVVRAPAERLPVESESFDCAVATLALCTVRDPVRTLAELRRALKPRGRLLFVEHVRSEDPAVARWQDRLRRPWSWFALGCQCNRPTVDIIRGAGFSVAELRRGEFPNAPAIVRPLVAGWATPLGADRGEGPQD